MGNVRITASPTIPAHRRPVIGQEAIVNQDKQREGQGMGRTTGASSEQREQQRRTIEGQESQPGKVWQESDKSQYTGHGDTNVGGSDPRGGDTDRAERVNEQLDETQWQGNRFGQGGFGGQGGSGR
jgi:hypothetical protein